MLVELNNFAPIIRITSNYNEINLYGTSRNKSLLEPMKNDYAGEVNFNFYGSDGKVCLMKLDKKFVKKAGGVNRYIMS